MRKSDSALIELASMNTRGRNMIPSAVARTDYVKKIISENKPVRTRRVYYKAKTVDLNVYRFDLNFLIFNQYNDRIAVEMKTRVARLGEASTVYTEELENIICDILYKESEHRNKHTLENLKNIGQQEPGVITLDGVIIDGNRRAMLLKKHLKTTWFEAGVINEVLADNRKYIRELETQIQFGTDSKVDYEPINKYLKVKDFIELDNLGIPEIAKLFDEPEPKIREYKEIMSLMDDYLEHIGAKGMYTLLRFVTKDGSREGSFVDLRSNLNQLRKEKGNIGWAYTPNDVDDYQRLYFDYIRSECTDPKDFRRLAPARTNSKGGIFMNESIFKSLMAEHDKAVVDTYNQMSLQEYTQQEENKQLSLNQIADKREKDWIVSVEKGMENRIRRSIAHWNDLVDEKKPSEYLSDSLKKLEMITERHLESEEFLGDFEAQENAKKINSKIYRIKKAMGL